MVVARLFLIYGISFEDLYEGDEGTPNFYLIDVEEKLVESRELEEEDYKELYRHLDYYERRCFCIRSERIEELGLTVEPLESERLLPLIEVSSGTKSASLRLAYHEGRGMLVALSLMLVSKEPKELKVRGVLLEEELDGEEVLALYGLSGKGYLEIAYPDLVDYECEYQRTKLDLSYDRFEPGDWFFGLKEDLIESEEEIEPADIVPEAEIEGRDVRYRLIPTKRYLCQLKDTKGKEYKLQFNDLDYLKGVLIALKILGLKSEEHCFGPKEVKG